MEELEGLSLTELRQVAKEMGIKGITALRKQELYDFLVKAQQKSAQTQNPVQKRQEMPVKKTAAQERQRPEYSKNDRRMVERKQTERERHTPEQRNQRQDDANKRNTYNQKALSRYAERQNMPKKENTGRNDNRNTGRYEGKTYARNESKNYQRTDNRKAEDHAGENQRMDTRRTEGHALNSQPTDIGELDSGEIRTGILEVLPEGYGFIRCDNYLPGEEDCYVSPMLIRKYKLRTGDILKGNIRVRSQNEKFAAMLYLTTVNGYSLDKVVSRTKFENLTPIFPNKRISLETPGTGISMRMMDLISPIGKGQRGMIVSQPKTGKTTLLKQVARAVKINHPNMHIIVLLIDERPEEVTDIKESIQGKNVEVIYSTFDELPENHKRVSEMVIERAKRLVEHGEDVMILLDSITRLARAYNLTVQPSGRTLSGGLDPAALHMPKRFFGAARNMREGGSLTILATALVDTGSKMDDVVFEEFKGTGNMELVLDRSLSEKRVFPAIDLPKSSTRREDLLLSQDEIEATFLMRKAFSSSRSDEAVQKIIDMFRKTKNNQEFVQLVKKVKIV
ncbi:MAG: transcription termination factor Rho [Clostridiaceae bacterium]|nr:transcription termination factor Rho [Clostridiaceae bacterium]